jgi:hypothetical protein
MSTRQWRRERLPFLVLSASLTLLATGCDEGAPSNVEPSASVTPASDTAANPVANPTTESTGLPEAQLPDEPGMAPDPTAEIGEMPVPVQMAEAELVGGSMPEIAPPTPPEDPAGVQMTLGSVVSGVALGMSLDDVVSVLGEPAVLPNADNAFAASTWTDRGFTAEWDASGANGVTLNAFVVAEDSAMVNGSAIGIGSPRVYVDLVYAVDGIERAETESTLTFSHDNRSLRFAFDADGKVTEIGAGLL